MCMSVLPTCMSGCHCMPDVQEGQKRESDPLELELQGFYYLFIYLFFETGFLSSYEES